MSLASTLKNNPLRARMSSLHTCYIIMAFSTIRSVFSSFIVSSPPSLPMDFDHSTTSTPYVRVCDVNDSFFLVYGEMVDGEFVHFTLPESSKTVFESFFSILLNGSDEVVSITLKSGEKIENGLEVMRKEMECMIVFICTKEEFFKKYCFDDVGEENFTSLPSSHTIELNGVFSESIVLKKYAPFNDRYYALEGLKMYRYVLEDMYFIHF